MPDQARQPGRAPPAAASPSGSSGAAPTGARVGVGEALGGHGPGTLPSAPSAATSGVEVQQARAASRRRARPGTGRRCASRATSTARSPAPQRPGDVGPQVVADVHAPRRRGTPASASPAREDRRVRLGRADLGRRDDAVDERRPARCRARTLVERDVPVADDDQPRAAPRAAPAGRPAPRGRRGSAGRPAARRAAASGPSARAAGGSAPAQHRGAALAAGPPARRRRAASSQVRAVEGDLGPHRARLASGLRHAAPRAASSARRRGPGGSELDERPQRVEQHRPRGGRSRATVRAHGGRHPRSRHRRDRRGRGDRPGRSPSPGSSAAAARAERDSRRARVARSTPQATRGCASCGACLRRDAAARRAVPGPGPVRDLRPARRRGRWPPARDRRRGRRLRRAAGPGQRDRRRRRSPSPSRSALGDLVDDRRPARRGRGHHADLHLAAHRGRRAASSSRTSGWRSPPAQRLDPLAHRRARGRPRTSPRRRTRGSRCGRSGRSSTSRRRASPASPSPAAIELLVAGEPVAAARAAAPRGRPARGGARRAAGGGGAARRRCDPA